MSSTRRTADRRVVGAAAGCPYPAAETAQRSRVAHGGGALNAESCGSGAHRSSRDIEPLSGGLQYSCRGAQPTDAPPSGHWAPKPVPYAYAARVHPRACPSAQARSKSRAACVASRFSFAKRKWWPRRKQSSASPSSHVVGAAGGTGEVSAVAVAPRAEAPQAVSRRKPSVEGLRTAAVLTTKPEQNDVDQEVGGRKPSTERRREACIPGRDWRPAKLNEDPNSRVRIEGGEGCEDGWRRARDTPTVPMARCAISCRTLCRIGWSSRFESAVRSVSVARAPSPSCEPARRSRSRPHGGDAIALRSRVA